MSTDLADDEKIRATRAHIESAVHAAKLAHDPSAAILDGGMMLIEVMQGILRRFEAAAKKPAVTEADVQQLSQAAARGADRRAAALVQAHLLRYLTVGISVVVLTALVAGVGAYALAGGFRTTCYGQDGGRVFCGYWVEGKANAR